MGYIEKMNYVRQKEMQIILAQRQWSIDSDAKVAEIRQALEDGMEAHNMRMRQLRLELLDLKEDAVRYQHRDTITSPYAVFELAELNRARKELGVDVVDIPVVRLVTPRRPRGMMPGSARWRRQYRLDHPGCSDEELQAAVVAAYKERDARDEE